MKETKKYDNWMKLLTVSVIVIIACVFTLTVTNTHLAKGTYATKTGDKCDTLGQTTTDGNCTCVYGFGGLQWDCTSTTSSGNTASATGTVSPSNPSLATGTGSTNGSTCVSIVPSGWLFGGESKSTCEATAEAACGGVNKYDGCQTATHDEDNTVSCYTYRCNGTSSCASLISSGWLFGGESSSTCVTTAEKMCGTGKYQGCQSATHDEDNTVSCYSYKCISTNPSGNSATSSKTYTIKFKDAGGTRNLGICTTGTNGKLSSSCSAFDCCDEWIGSETLTTSQILNKTFTSDDTYKCKAGSSHGCYDYSGDPTPKPASNSSATPNNSTNKPSSTSTSNSDVPNNPGTGTAGIIVAWLVGLSAIVYSLWYFKKTKF